MTPPIEPLRITVLGSGTSVGVPTVGCHCDVCGSGDPRDKRLRPSILLRYNQHNVLVDTTPDFRYQALRAGIERVDAVLFTHAHADHIMGLDDIRPFNFQRRGQIPIFGSPETMAIIRRCFEYVFNDVEKEKETPIPRLEIRTLDGSPFELFGREVIPVPLMHGKQPIYGFRIGQAAYLTDHSEIPEESFELLRGLDVLFLDALRHRPHPTHSTVERSTGYVEKLAPRRAFFTHICHDLPHARTEETLPPNVRLAYDGLELVVEEDR
jgi:phosphoribosyl 1,2-cyclic phosphate phosphodiesterase